MRESLIALENISFEFCKNELNIDLQYAMDYEFWIRLAKKYRFKHIKKILAADRNHPKRKIISEFCNLEAEIVDVQNTYGYKKNLWNKVGRIFDQIFSGIPRRIKGLFLFISLKNKEFAFPAKFHLSFKIIKNHVFLRDFKNL